MRGRDRVRARRLLQGRAPGLVVLTVPGDQSVASSACYLINPGCSIERWLPLGDTTVPLGRCRESTTVPPRIGLGGATVPLAHHTQKLIKGGAIVPLSSRSTHVNERCS